MQAPAGGPWPGGAPPPGAAPQLSAEEALAQKVRDGGERGERGAIGAERAAEKQRDGDGAAAVWGRRPLAAAGPDSTPLA